MGQIRDILNADGSLQNLKIKEVDITEDVKWKTEPLIESLSGNYVVHGYYNDRLIATVTCRGVNVHYKATKYVEIKRLDGWGFRIVLRKEKT